MLLKTLRRAAIGFLLGMAVGNIITVVSSMLSGGQVLFFTDALLLRTGNEVLAFLVQTLLSGVIGAVAWAAMGLFEIETWGLVRAEVTHCLLILLTLIPIALYLGWMKPTFESVVLLSGCMAFSDVVVFCIMTAYYHREVAELNEMLKDAGQLA